MSQGKGDSRKTLRVPGSKRHSGERSGPRNIPVRYGKVSSRPYRKDPRKKFRKKFRRAAISGARPRNMPENVWRYACDQGIDPGSLVCNDGTWIIRRATDTKEDSVPQLVALKPRIADAGRKEPSWARAAGSGIRFVGPCTVKPDSQQWLARGIPQQINGANTRKIRVMLGLDFGTAYTKVVARVANDSHAIEFDKVVQVGNPFLLPAVLSVDRHGIGHLGRLDSAASVTEDLKLHFIEKSHTQPQDAVFVAFMALVIRAARAWLFERHGALLGTREIDWGFNLGAPTVPWEDKTIRDKYLRLLEAACLVSQFDRPVSVRECETTLATVAARRTPLKDRIGVFAEFAAQIAGYIHSPRMQEGPHLLVDVGAGTIDVTMFNVFQPGDVPSAQEALDQGMEMVADTRFPIWDARVEKLGGYYLSAARATGGTSWQQDPEAAFEGIESIAAYCERTGASREGVEAVEAEFAKYVAGCVGGVISRTKAHRYRRFHWSESSIPTFICGGGARYPLYESAVRKAAANFPVRLAVLPLPAPDGLRQQGIEETLFDRLSVAYGLTFEGADIGQIVPSWIIPDESSLREPTSPIRDFDPTDRDQAE